MRKIFNWIGRRLQEPSTYAGMATAAAGIGAAVGKPELGSSIGPVVTVLSYVLPVVGGALIGHSTVHASPQGVLRL